MKKVLTLPFCITVMLGTAVNAQNTFPATGRAGIYTTNPVTSLQVRGGARIGTASNYVNIDSATGKLSFVGTGVYQVAGNKYAFQYATNPNYGLFFNSTSVQYEFRNGSAVPVFSINANSGNSVFNGTLKVGAYTLPAADGANGQVLKTNGSGTLTWSNDNSGSGSGWALTGNAGTDSSIHFIGTTDAHPLVFRVNNQKSGWIDFAGKNNTSFGYQGLLANTTGINNTANGWAALYSNNGGNENTAIGGATLNGNVTGNDNTAIGFAALNWNNANNNTATGAYALYANTDGQQNTATGYSALISNTKGNFNVATGVGALWTNKEGNNNAAFGSYSLFYNTTGSNNTASGYQALYNNTGDENTATGAYSLLLNTSGIRNTAIGYAALNVNSTGNYNTATGNLALHDNNGSSNTATGYLSLLNNQTGFDNAAFGVGSLEKNVVGYQNTAIGNNALGTIHDGRDNTAIGFNAMRGINSDGTGYFSFSTAIGSYALYSATAGHAGSGAWSNTAVGYSSLYSNTSGRLNTALGVTSLSGNVAGLGNTAVGLEALYSNNNGDWNTAIGVGALRSNITGENNTGVGYGADVNSDGYSNSTALGVGATITASNQVRIGAVGSNYGYDPTSIGGKVMWSTLSDGRVKKNIKENVPGLSFINKLKPLTYKIDDKAADKIIQRPAIKNKDGKAIKPSEETLAAAKANAAIVYTGFAAQDVEKAAKSLNYDFSGVDVPKNGKDLYGLRYAAFVVPLVKAVQELSKMNDDKDEKINALEARLSRMEEQLKINPSTVSFADATLDQNMPNPFTHSTVINYLIPQKFTSAQIVITDKNGKTLKAVTVSGSGKGTLNVNASTLASGAYQYSLIIDGKLVAAKQMIIVK